MKKREFLRYVDLMPVALTPEQQARLSAWVARGDFASVEDAASQLIDERIAERALEEGDDALSRDEHRARNMSRLAGLKG